MSELLVANSFVMPNVLQRDVESTNDGFLIGTLSGIKFYITTYVPDNADATSSDAINELLSAFDAKGNSVHLSNGNAAFSIFSTQSDEHCITTFFYAKTGKLVLNVEFEHDEASKGWIEKYIKAFLIRNEPSDK